MAYTVEQLKRIIASDDKTIDNFTRNLTEQDKQELLDLYKQEGIYYYTQVAPQTQAMGKALCEERVDCISKLTTQARNLNYEHLVYQICVFNIRNSRFIDNKLAQV